MLRSILCNHSDAHILLNATITALNTAVSQAESSNRKNITIKNCATFTNCISEINNTQIDNAKEIGIVMPMYNLIEYSDNYFKTSRSLWHYCRHKPFLNADGTIGDFPTDNNNSALFKLKKKKIAGRTGNDGTKNVKLRKSTFKIFN